MPKIPPYVSSLILVVFAACGSVVQDTTPDATEAPPTEADARPMVQQAPDAAPPDASAVDAGSDDCRVTPGLCGQGQVCLATGLCAASVCGDTIVDPSMGEECDDGNTIDDDGCTNCRNDCSSSAECDDGDSCTGVETCSGACQPGTLQAPGTGCSSNATPSGSCRSYGATSICVLSTCGNGTVEAGERCDDGNTIPGDGCEIDCRFTCETNPSLPNLWYADCDDDGYVPVNAQSIQACLQPPTPSCGGRWIMQPPSQSDCDDSSANNHPGATETCDGVDNDCNNQVDEISQCNISCNWSSARWLSHGWDGINMSSSGAWVSCMNGTISYVKWQANAGTGVNPSPSGTSDIQVGCNWSGERWASQGWDGAPAFTTGATVSCDGSRVTAMSWETNTLAEQAAQSGQLGCNWNGAVHLTHGWDGGCAFSTGFSVTCHNSRITDFQWVEGCPRSR